MSSEASPSSKRGAVSNEIDAILPLLFAAHPDWIPNYRKMASMDSQRRYSHSALEHKFRKWRQTARRIVAAHPEGATSADVVGEIAKPKTKRAPKASQGVKDKQAGAGDGEDDEEAGGIAVKKEKGNQDVATTTAVRILSSNSNKGTLLMVTAGQCKKGTRQRNPRWRQEASLDDNGDG